MINVDDMISLVASLSGKVAAKLAGSDYIQTAVLLHPSRVTIDEIKGKF